ncbi:MAG: hypothetical protein M1826_007420, partial [Phylliscum demangeonii]
TLFTRTEAKRASKAEKVERAAELEREKERERERDQAFRLMNAEASSSTSTQTPPPPPPPPRRNSRDTRSIATEEESVAESHESTERPTSASASGSPSESAASATASGSSAKEKASLFQKIGRKGSSGKFNVPWKGGSMRSKQKMPDPSTAGDAEAEETPGSEPAVGRTSERSDSVATSPSMSGGRSGMLWSSLMRKPKTEDAASEKPEDAASGETEE